MRENGPPQKPTSNPSVSGYGVLGSLDERIGRRSLDDAHHADDLLVLRHVGRGKDLATKVEIRNHGRTHVGHTPGEVGVFAEPLGQESLRPVVGPAGLLGAGRGFRTPPLDRIAIPARVASRIHARQRGEQLLPIQQELLMLR